MKNYILISLLFFMIFSCDNDLLDFEKEKENIINTDLEFSKMSEKEGMKKAFLVFADEDAVLLRENSFPIEGKEKIGKRFTEFSDTSFMMTWKPVQVFISESVDLAYTYGIYTLVMKNDTSETRGTYLSIWKNRKTALGNGFWTPEIKDWENRHHSEKAKKFFKSLCEI